MINKSNRIGAILTKAIPDVERSEILIYRGWIQIFFTKTEVNLKTQGERI